MTRAEWFFSLSRLTYPAAPNRAETGFMPFMPWFDDLPAAVWTKGSLEAVVTSPRKMAIPSYDEIRRPLAAWWRDNRPAEQRLASEYAPLPSPEPRGEPSDIERQAVAEMVKSFKATTSIGRSHLTTPEAERPKPRYLADQQLLAEYERVAGDDRLDIRQRNAAAYRAGMLREKLGMETRHAAE